MRRSPDITAPPASEITPRAVYENRRRLLGQVGDVEDVLDDQGVDHVFDDAHEIGIEPVKVFADNSAEKDADIGVIGGEELGIDRGRVAQQAGDGATRVAGDVGHGAKAVRCAAQRRPAM